MLPISKRFQDFLERQGTRLQFEIKQGGKPTPQELKDRFQMLNMFQAMLSRIENPKTVAYVESFMDLDV